MLVRQAGHPQRPYGRRADGHRGRPGRGRGHGAGRRRRAADQPATAYEVLCRDHHRRGVTRAVAQAGRTDPLPFERRGRCPVRSPVGVGRAAGRRAGRGRDASPAIVLVDVRWTLNGPPGRPAYEAGHLPGARLRRPGVRADHPRPGGRPPSAAGPRGLQRAMRRIGVSARDPGRRLRRGDLAGRVPAVVAADRCRAPDVRVLDGGYAAWQAAGRPVETGPGPTPTAGDFVVESGHRRVVDADAVAALSRLRSRSALVDVRAADRYAGEDETDRPDRRPHPRRA